MLVLYGPNSINLNLTLSSTYWLWLFIAVTVILNILAVLFEGLSESCVRRCEFGDWCPKLCQDKVSIGSPSNCEVNTCCSI